MCVAAVAWDAHPRWLLVAVGNRDEYHDRPTAPLARWDDEAGTIAGRDLKGGGTWLGVSEAGRFALVTNYRVPEGPQLGRPTRGALVADLLAGRTPTRTAAMNPFNLVYADIAGASFLSNHPEEIALPLPPGIHGLSNGGFGSPWPKTRRLNAALAAWLESGAADFAPLFDAMRDETRLPGEIEGPAPDPRLSPVFIRDPLYGTRCSTVVAFDRQGRGSIVERSFDADGAESGERSFTFAWGSDRGTATEGS